MTGRILVVEDDLLNRMLLCDVLRTDGFIIEAIDDGAKVIPAVDSFQPDLITMDINLPNVSGLDLITLLRSDPSHQKIPILAITAYVGRGEERSILAAGAQALIAKPLSIKPFLAAIHRLMPEESLS